MRFRVLGPLDVEDVADTTALRRPKPRALLAYLLVHANEVVSTDSLVAALWDEEAPPSALGALQNYVSLLRKALGDRVLETKPPGYVLRVAAGDLDVVLFYELVGRASDADLPARIELLEQALALWRGSPLAEFTADYRWAEEACAQLEDARAAAQEQRLGALVDVGRAADAIPELEALIRKNRYDERRWRLHMLALYRAGRQADALAAFQEARRSLDEAGVEPGEELRRLQRLILLQDETLAGPEREPDDARPVRKPVTVLVASVCPRDPQVDPEVLRAILRDVEPALRGAIHEHGGTCAALASGDLTSFFGVPVAHEDDALRAVRAADAIRRAVARIGGWHPSAAVVRIGVESGEAVVEVNGGEPTVTTSAVPAARRLNERASDGDVLVGAGVAARVRGSVSLERVEPSPTYDAFRVREIEPTQRDLFAAPLVGRRAELARLEDELRRAEADRACRVVTVVGDPGIGKTRVVEEFVARAQDAARILWGECSAYGEGASFAPLAAVVRDAIQELGGGDERDEIAERLRGLAGISDEPVPAGDAFWAVRRFVEQLGSRRSVVLVVEDAQWAEPTFLDLLEYLRDWTRDAAVLIVATARPEILDVRPSLGATALVVGPLSDDGTASLARSLGVVDDDAVAQIVRASEGNPLFAAQMSVEAATDPDGGLDPPATVEALLASRIDLLPPPALAVAQRASVLGRDFDRAGIVEVTLEAERSSVDAELAALVSRGFVRRGRREGTFLFQHGLVRDAAYASVPIDVRAALHERAARHVATTGADELVGFHLETASGYLRSLGDLEAAEALGRQATVHLDRAGMRAFGRADIRAAEALLARAVALLPASDRRRGALQCELALTAFVRGDADAAITGFVSAEEEAASSFDRSTVVRARLERKRVELVVGRGEPADDVAAAADAAIGELDPGDDRALGRAWLIRGDVLSAFLCRNLAAVDALERAIEHYRAADFPPSVCVAQLASALYYGPTPAPDAIVRCERALASRDAGRNGDAIVRSYLAGLEAFRGNFAEARALLDHATTTLIELSQPIAIAHTTDPVRAEVEMLAGNLAAAERTLRAACETAERLGQPAHVGTHGASLADVLYAQGRLDEADEWARRAELSAGVGDISAHFSWRAAAAKIAARGGDAARAQALARDAVAIVDKTDALNQRAKVRLALADVLSLSGDDRAATAARAEAARMFDDKGNVVAARSVRAADA